MPLDERDYMTGRSRRREGVYHTDNYYDPSTAKRRRVPRVLVLPVLALIVGALIAAAAFTSYGQDAYGEGSYFVQERWLDIRWQIEAAKDVGISRQEALELDRAGVIRIADEFRDTRGRG